MNNSFQDHRGHHYIVIRGFDLFIRVRRVIDRAIVLETSDEDAVKEFIKQKKRMITNDK